MGCLLAVWLCPVSHVPCCAWEMGQKFHTKPGGTQQMGTVPSSVGGRQSPSGVPHPSMDFVSLLQLGSESPWCRGQPQSSTGRKEMMFNISKQLIENLLLPGAGPDPACPGRGQDRGHLSPV